MTNDLRERFNKKKAPLKAMEIMEAGYSYKEILALEASGKIRRIKSGYYTCPEVDIPEEEMVFALFPDGIFTMETALYYLGYLSERSMHWSIAVSKNVSKSRFNLDYPVIHPYYCEQKVLEFGVTTIETNYGKIRIYDKDRLICEVLKYENKMDRDNFKLAVLAYISDREKNTSKFLDYAEKRRVINKARTIIGPWL